MDLSLLLEVLKWIVIVFIAGFIGYFGKYMSKIIIAKLHKRKLEKLEREKEEEWKNKKYEYKIQKKKIKLEKKKMKLEKKKEKNKKKKD